jgi:hypothetical protein
MKLDGRYARLVKIQSQIARNQKFAAALETPDDEPLAEFESPPEPEAEPHDAAFFAPTWLLPGSVNLARGPLGTLDVSLPDGPTHAGVFAVRCFPAATPHDFISLRTWDKDGHEHEIGILRFLDQWSPGEQALIANALARRYHLKRVLGIFRVKHEFGLLFFDVTTDHGPASITMRWSHSQAQDFGEHGKVLIDTEDNRFLIPNVQALPPRDRELFLRYIYW